MPFADPEASCLRPDHAMSKRLRDADARVFEAIAPQRHAQALAWPPEPPSAHWRRTNESGQPACLPLNPWQYPVHHSAQYGFPDVMCEGGGLAARPPRRNTSDRFDTHQVGRTFGNEHLYGPRWAMPPPAPHHYPYHSSFVPHAPFPHPGWPVEQRGSHPGHLQPLAPTLQAPPPWHGPAAPPPLSYLRLSLQVASPSPPVGDPPNALLSTARTQQIQTHGPLPAPCAPTAPYGVSPPLPHPSTGDSKPLDPEPAPSAARTAPRALNHWLPSDDVAAVSPPLRPGSDSDDDPDAQDSSGEDDNGGAEGEEGSIPFLPGVSTQTSPSGKRVLLCSSPGCTEQFLGCVLLLVCALLQCALSCFPG